MRNVRIGLVTVITPLLLVGCGASNRSSSSGVTGLKSGCKIALTYIPGTSELVDTKEYAEYHLVSEGGPRSFLDDRSSEPSWDPLVMTWGHYFQGFSEKEVHGFDMVKPCETLYGALTAKKIPVNAANTSRYRKSYFVSDLNVEDFPQTRAEALSHPAFAVGPQTATVSTKLRIATYEVTNLPNLAYSVSLVDHQDLPVEISCDKPFKYEAKDTLGSYSQAPIGENVCEFVGPNGSQSNYKCVRLQTVSSADDCTVTVNRAEFKEEGKISKLSFEGRLKKNTASSVDSKYQLRIEKIAVE